MIWPRSAAIETNKKTILEKEPCMDCRFGILNEYNRPIGCQRKACDNLVEVDNSLYNDSVIKKQALRFCLFDYCFQDILFYLIGIGLLWSLFYYFGK